MTHIQVPTSPILVNGDRLWSSLMDIAKIGAIPGDGSCRLSLTNEDKMARDLFAHWCRQAGLEVCVDPYGNMFATRQGLDTEAPHILIGSHLDTQPHGGRFDGVLGVLAGLEVLRSLNDRDVKTRCPITVVNWTNEEGVRFKPGLTGSAGFVRSLDASSVTGDGVDFFKELKRIGYDGPKKKINVEAYYELHIEQGPVLERAGVQVGIVEGIQGVRWYEAVFEGQDAHAGTTPFMDRKDAFMAAASTAMKLRHEALNLDASLRFTAGKVEVSPNSINTIPGYSKLVFDVRHRDKKILDEFEEIISNVVATMPPKEGVKGSLKRVMDVAPAIFSASMQRRLFDSAEQLGIVPISLPSGAMHDASSIAPHYPTAMVFVQSRGGISHNPAEWSDPEHIANACAVLANAVLAHSVIEPGQRRKAIAV